MNRRSFVASLAALPALLFGRKATATPLHGPVEQPDFQLLAFHAPPEWRAEVQPKAVPEDAPRVPVADQNERLYTDIALMFEDISEHTRRTGDVILNADNPRRFPPTMGFWAQPADDGPGVGWSIALPDLAKSLKVMEAKPDPVPPIERMKMGGPGPSYVASPAMKATIFREYFKTSEGRKMLSRAFPGQRS